MADNDLNTGLLLEKAEQIERLASPLNRHGLKNTRKKALSKIHRLSGEIIMELGGIPDDTFTTRSA